MLLALVIWGVFAWLLIADYGPDYRGRPMCRGPLIELPSDSFRCRDAWREWPALLGVLALAVLATVVAAATTVYERLLSRLAGRNNPTAQSGN
ncbi:hypothetical protein [Streptomyces sp. NPDC056987]|uniref:hypothetical protein n=1 Tax=Streptomyces sp. NPDC056987 TaxID=3345988 RepID=UPI00362A49A9